MRTLTRGGRPARRGLLVPGDPQWRAPEIGFLMGPISREQIATSHLHLHSFFAVLLSRVLALFCAELRFGDFLFSP